MRQLFADLTDADWDEFGATASTAYAWLLARQQQRESERRARFAAWSAERRAEHECHAAYGRASREHQEKGADRP